MSNSVYAETPYGRVERRYSKNHTRIAELHASKNADYGEADVDPYANFRKASKAGVEPWRGAVVRMLDKVARIETFCQKGELENETVEDSFLDLANYALIALSLYQEMLDEEYPLMTVDFKSGTVLSHHPAATPFSEQWNISETRCPGPVGQTPFRCSLNVGHDGRHR